MQVMRDLVGAEFPLFAFSHCRDVVVAVSQAGGFGVLGGTGFTPEQLSIELDWIDRHIGGKPYGVDILVPEKQMFGKDETVTLEHLVSRVPTRHVDFLASILSQHGVSADRDSLVERRIPGMVPEIGEQLMDVAFAHPVRLMVSALGTAPKAMIERARKQGVPVGALVGAREHAVKQAQAGVDVIIAQGGEGGGHCGEVSTLVLIPEVLRALQPIRAVPVLAAGGIVTGQQMAACMALGAAGVWTGSVWLATEESETSPVFRQKMIAAGSRDTIRSVNRTGKPSRQLRSRWHDHWDSPQSPGALPMPLMSMLCEPAFGLIERSAEAGNPQARELVTYFVGQGVGLIDGVRTARRVVEDFKQEFADAIEHLMRDTGLDPG